MVKKENQCSSQGLSRNYLASKLAKWYLCINHKIFELLRRASINQLPFTCEICCDYQSHMARMMKSGILSICQRLSVKNIIKKYLTHFDQFAKILLWCYLLDIFYDVVGWIDNNLEILHQMIDQQHGESSFLLPFPR